MERVLFLDHSSQLGGAELSLLDLARNMPGCLVLLFADGPFRQCLVEAGVDVHIMFASGSVMGVRRESTLAALGSVPGVLALVRQVAKAARTYDIIHCNSQKAFIVGCLAGLLSRRPVVWHLRDMLTHTSFSGFNRKLAVTLANLFAALVIANSHATAEAFCALGGRRKKTAVLYNGITLKPVAPAQLAALREQLGIAVGAPVVGCFSRLSPWKGQHVLIEAVARLCSEFPNLQTLLIGSPLFGEDAYAEQLRDRVRGKGLSSRIRFLGFRSDIPELMALCDVVVNTSVEPEPFGRVIVEGQLAGKPVVATGAGGAVELIHHGETGLLVPPGDPVALAGALRRLLSDPALVQRVAEAGREQAAAEFSVERLTSGFRRLLAAVKSGGKTAS